MSTGIGAVAALASPTQRPHPPEPADRLRTPADTAFQVSTINQRLNTLARQVTRERALLDITV